MSDSMGTKEASDLRGVPQERITRWCRSGKIFGAEQDAKGSPWHIPKNAICPIPVQMRNIKKKEDK